MRIIYTREQYIIVCHDICFFFILKDMKTFKMDFVFTDVAGRTYHRSQHKRTQVITV
jgi:hypothetical protein